MPVRATYKPLFQAIITTSMASVHNPTAETIGKIHVCNYTSSDCWFSLKIGGTGDANWIFCQEIIPGNGSRTWDIPMTLEAADQVYAQAQTATSLAISGWGVENT